MYKLDPANYAADFFREQENLRVSRTNRELAIAQNERAAQQAEQEQKLFEQSQEALARQQEIQSITDQTVQQLAMLGRGDNNSAQKGAEALALDALGGESYKQQQTQPRTPGQLQPVDMSLGHMADTIGNTLMQAGFGTEGMAYVKEGLDYNQKLTKAANDQAKAQMERAQGYADVAQFMYEGLADVKDQATQDAFFNSLPPEVVEVIGRGNVAQMKKQPYDPDVVAHYRDKSLSTKETYDLQMTAEGHQMTLNRDAALNYDRTVKNKLALENLKLRAFEAKNQTKASGGGAIIKASSGEIKQAYNRVVATLFGTKAPKKGSAEDVMLQSAAQTIASEALQRAKDTAGLTYDQALTQVATAHRADFVNPTIEVEGMFGDYTAPGPTKFQPLGSVKERPIILKDMESAGKLVPGKWYSSNGRTIQYNP